MKRPIQRRLFLRLLSALLIAALGLPNPALALRPLNAGLEESPVRSQLEHELTSAAGLEEPDKETEALDTLDLTPLVSAILEAVASAVRQGRDPARSGEKPAISIRLKEGVVSISPQAVNNLLRDQMLQTPDSRPIPQNAETRQELTKRLRVLLSKEKPENPPDQALWKSAAARYLRERKIFGIQPFGAHNAVERLAESATDRASALLVVEEIQRRVAKSQSVRMDELWLTFLVFQDLVLQNKGDQTFQRLLKNLAAGFPETNRQGATKQAALVWKQIYPILIESSKPKAAADLERLFSSEADRIAREFPKSNQLNFSPLHVQPPNSSSPMESANPATGL